MILSEFKHIKITGIAGAVPTNWTSIESMITEENRDTLEKFSAMTGVIGRYDAGPLQTTSDLAYVAAKHLMNSKNIDPNSVQALIFVSQSPDYAIPATACVLHHRLGLPKECMAFDVNLGCSGYTYGINILASMMASSNITRALLLAGDTSAKEKSRMIKTKESNAYKMLFGDAGTATLLEKTDQESKIDCVSCTDGNKFRAIIKPFTGFRNPDGKGIALMNDVDVFNFTISEVPKMIKEYLSLKGKSPDDYDSLALHQANHFILKQIGKRTKFPMEKVHVSIDTFGNTSSASIPITLVKHFGASSETKALNILMCGFGVGLSWSLVSAELSANDILPLVQSDEYFLDGYEDEVNL
ncbi:MAG: ketoacyl-ACP synthase III [Candidatus Cloacimonetes bacterium]|nr:ketoacyl-ACP synthase III [Candidatus Cloacimonadota bacterium]